MFSQQHHVQQGNQPCMSYRPSQPSARPAGHVTSPTHTLPPAGSQASALENSLGSSSHQPAQVARQRAADEQHRSALHAALYGPRAGSGGGPHGSNPGMGVFKAYDGPLPSKAAMADGQLVQHTKPLDPALLAAAAPWQADMMAAMADVVGMAAGGQEPGEHGHTIRLNSAPLPPHGMYQAAHRPPVSYATYCKERGMVPRPHSSAPLLQAQQQLQMQMARQQARSQDLPREQRPSLDLSAPAQQAQQAHTPMMFGALTRGAEGPEAARLASAAEPAPRPSLDLQEVIMQAAAAASKHHAHHPSASRMLPPAATAPTATSTGTSAVAGGRAAPAAPSAAHKAPAGAASHSALYQRQPMRLDPGAMQEHKAKHNQLLAHLAATAGTKHPHPHSPNYASAEAMQLSPVYTAAAGASTAAKEPAPAIEMSESGSESAAATYWGSQESSYLECEEEWDSQPNSLKSGKHARVLQLACVYAPSVHTDHSSASALAIANKILSTLSIPDGVMYLPVRFESKLYALGVRFGFTAFSIALGSSYFQRLLAVMPQLEFAVRRCGAVFADYLSCLPSCPKKRLEELQATYGPHYTSQNHLSEEATLTSIQFTCVYLATKVVDRMPMMEMLRYILTHLYGSLVSKSQAYDVESKCLEGLKFRLGPFFSADVMSEEP